MRGRLVVRISPDDVGRRVSVRSRLTSDPGAATTTDTLGVLRSWEGGVLRIERRDGTHVALREEDLLAGRTVPDPPQRRPPRYSA